MARPRTDIGTYGAVNTKPIGPKRFESEAWFRMRNGRLKRVSRRGDSRTAAERALKRALAQLANETAGKTINADSRMGHVMDLWLADWKTKVERGERAPKSLQEYRSVVNTSLRPQVGELTCREAENAGLCDEVLKNIRGVAGKSKRGKDGYAAAKRAKTVLSNICGYAVRHGAMNTNPVKSAEALEQGDKDPILALEPGQREDFLAQLEAWVERKVTAGKYRHGARARAWTDLPDLALGMLSTGCRIGEALALVGEGIDPTNRTVLADHHLVRVEGQGIRRIPKRKGKGEELKLRVPSWSVAMWRRRKLESGGGPLFPSWNGQWEDPSNVARRFRKACDGIGYGWMSSRMFRHTTGSHLGDSDVPDEQIADQLGNTPQVVRKHYRRPKIANEKIADALETMLDTGESGAPG